MKKITNKQKYIIALLSSIAIVLSISIFIKKRNTGKIQPVITHTQSASSAVNIPKKNFIKKRKKPVYPQVIPGKIVTLKVLSPTYAFDYYKMFSPKVRKGLGFQEKITFSYVENRIRYEVGKMKKGSRIVYSIWDNKVDKFIGTIQIREKNKEEPGQLGMWLNENFWGGGRIQEAMYLISRAYFDSRPTTDSYIAFVRPWNPRSYKSLIKFGFKKIGEGTYNSGEGDQKVYIYEMTRNFIDQKSKLSNLGSPKIS
jgi:RimJ/RimL family protein N-acetyltransferase